MRDKDTTCAAQQTLINLSRNARLDFVRIAFVKLLKFLEPQAWPVFNIPHVVKNLSFLIIIILLICGCSISSKKIGLYLILWMRFL